MKFRPVRGMFKDSLKEMKQVESLEDLEKCIAPAQFVNVVWQGFDARPEWNADSYLVIGKYPDGDEHPCGYLDRQVVL